MDMKSRKSRLGDYLSGRSPKSRCDGKIKVPELVLPIGTFPMTRQGILVSSKSDYPPGIESWFVPRNEDELIFLDSSVFDYETSQSFWDVLINVHNPIIVINSVKDELRQWLKNNPGNYAVSALKAKKLVLNSISEFVDHNKATYRYYVNLLVERKLLLTKWWMYYRSKTNAEPNEVEILAKQTKIQNLYGIRTLGLAKKYFRKDLRPSLLEHTYYTDESLVYIATISAIRTGRSVTIFSKDEDIPEQLFKLRQLIHLHYASMNFANMFMAAPDQHRSQNIIVPTQPWSNILDDLTVTFVERPDDNVDSYYPPQWEPVLVKCINIGQKLHFSGFAFETGMRQILDLKEKTGGLNVDWNNGKNFHIDPFPLRILSPYRFCSAITYDKRRPLLWAAPKIPELDYYHVLFDRERYKIVEC